MKRLLLVNTSINTTSTGRIAEEIGELAAMQGYECYAAYGVKNNASKLQSIRIGNTLGRYTHALASRLRDKHGFGSRRATRAFIREVEQLQPDLINLHNIHGYYLNIELLFNYLQRAEIPVVWTLHDCWPFTGHCSYFDAVQCNKWKTGCHHCPNLRAYPASWFQDNSRSNYNRKHTLFRGVKHLTFVAPCEWMAGVVRHSFMGDYPVEVIHNGVDLATFRPVDKEAIRHLRKRWSLNDRKIILGVASVWDKRKGLDDFIRLNTMLDPDEQIILIGLNDTQIKSLPHGILGIRRTENIAELSAFYTLADVFVNPTYVDNFPTTNIEALACGTPVVTYATGGSPEAIDNQTGICVDRGDLSGLLQAIRRILRNTSSDSRSSCRKRAESHFDKNERFGDYIRLFDRLI